MIQVGSITIQNGLMGVALNPSPTLQIIDSSHKILRTVSENIYGVSPLFLLTIYCNLWRRSSSV